MRVSPHPYNPRPRMYALTARPPTSYTSGTLHARLRARFGSRGRVRLDAARRARERVWNAARAVQVARARGQLAVERPLRARSVCCAERAARRGAGNAVVLGDVVVPNRRVGRQRASRGGQRRGRGRRRGRRDARPLRRAHARREDDGRVGEPRGPAKAAADDAAVNDWRPRGRPERIGELGLRGRGPVGKAREVRVPLGRAKKIREAARVGRARAAVGRFKHERPRAAEPALERRAA